MGRHQRSTNDPAGACASKNILMTISLQRQAGRVRPARVDSRNTRAAQQPAGLFLQSAKHREPFRGTKEPSDLALIHILFNN